MKPIIRAAVDSGRPPLELLLDDPGRKRSKWDGKLIKALYLCEAFEIEGYPVWVEESDAVTFKAKRKRIRSLAVVEAAQETHNKKERPEKGIRFYAEAKLKPGRTWPTRKEWTDRRAGRDVEANVKDAAEAARISEAEERAKLKAANDPEVAAILAEFEEKRNKRAGKMD